MTNGDEDDKEEERPEELDNQLDLHKRRTWAVVNGASRQHRQKVWQESCNVVE